LDPNFKSIQTTSKFKQTLRANLFKVFNYYLLGSRKCNLIHTRLRHQCSSLGADFFRANIISDPSCACGCPDIGIDKLFDFFKDLNSDSEGNVYEGQLDMDEGTLEQINSHINLPKQKTKFLNVSENLKMKEQAVKMK
jgi:hypothetical protein